MTIGRLERVPLREVWKHEEYDFTRWLQENIDVLNDAIDVTITNVEREQAAGSFSVDLIGEDEAGNAVIIENQLEKSNHDHLGKLITYLTAFEAKTAIWIVSEPRPEHAAAINWLNQSTSASFYLLKVEAVRIGPSPAALLLTRIVGPSEETRVVGEAKKEIAETHSIRREFWTGLLEVVRSRTNLHANLSPGQYHWIGTSVGRSGLKLSYVIRQHDGQVEFYIDQKDERENKAIFDYLFAQREIVESAFGGPLKWERLDEKRASRISSVTSIGGFRDKDRWPEIHDAMVDSMIRLADALKSHMDKLPR